jgi:hypothetical protein
MDTVKTIRATALSCWVHAELLYARAFDHARESTSDGRDHSPTNGTV